MRNVPDYIAKILQSVTNWNEKTLNQEFLNSEVQKPADRDFLRAFALGRIRTDGDPNYVIEHCNEFLPTMTDISCRFFVSDIRIWMHEKLERYDEAVILRLEKGEEHEDWRTQYLSIGRLYAKNKDTANAIKYYEMYMAYMKDSVDVEECSELANLYEDAKDFKNSAKYHEKVAVWHSRFAADAWMRAGRALALDGQTDEAFTYFKFSLKIDPKDAHTHYYMGFYYQIRKDKFRALHHYLEALKYNPDFFEANLNIAKMEFEEEGDVRAAINCFEAALEKDVDGRYRFDMYRTLRNLYGSIKEFEKEAYYRGKVFELAGFPPDMGEYLDSLNEDDLEYDDGEEAA